MNVPALTVRQKAAQNMLAMAGDATTTSIQPPLIKLCGMSREKDIETLNRLHPDMCGFIVDFPKSHRSITQKRLQKLSELVQNGITRVGVFVDAQPKTIAGLASDGLIDAVQLHGSENEAYIMQLRALTGIALIQAFCVRSADDIARAQASSADLVLLDNGQGSGKSFDWSLLAVDATTRPDRPFILAGGLGPDNVVGAIVATHPAGVDMSSGIETDKFKDPDKMLAAVKAVQNTLWQTIPDEQASR